MKHRIKSRWVSAGAIPAVSRSLEVALLVVLAVGLGGGCGKPSKAGGKRVVVIGCDGMDPVLLARMIDEGRMPHFKALRDEGTFKKLGTSIPPQSPVAWSNFINGTDPGGHGIFDFLHRKFEPNDPAIPEAEVNSEERHISAFFSTNEIKKGDPERICFGYVMPMPWDDPPKMVLMRGGTPFWEYLEQRKIPSRLYRIPANFPPSPSSRGYMKSLTDMGTPDLLGTQGKSTWFHPDFTEETKDPRGVDACPLVFDEKSGAWVATVKGIGNPLTQEHKELTLDLHITPDRASPVARISWTNSGPFGMSEEHEILLNEGEWSEWQRMVFKTARIDGNPVSCIARFWMKRVQPEPELYMSPLNIDPTHPLQPISEPAEFWEEVVDSTGLVYTQGFAEAFHALDASIRLDDDEYGNPRYVFLFDAPDYQRQAQIVLDERKRIMDYALKRFNQEGDGFLFFYFSSSDLVAHMFWWESEPDGSPLNNVEHPTRDAADAEKYTRVVEDIYEQLDDEVGKVRQSVGDQATVMVISDHGFARMPRKTSLNTWLYENGFIETLPGAGDTGSFASPDFIDWAHTKVYNIGLNGLYINLVGREPHGSVKPEDRNAVIEEVTAKLLAWRDPTLENQPVVYKVYRTDEVYHGDYGPTGAKNQYTPDLIVGFHRGYSNRFGAEGQLTKRTIYENQDEWSADHCVAAELVPGVFLCSKKIAVDDPNLSDIAPTILSEFGIGRPATMTGRNLFQPDKDEPRGER